MEFEVNELVYCRFKDKCYYKATVKEISQDGRYLIKWRGYNSFEWYRPSELKKMNFSNKEYVEKNNSRVMDEKQKTKRKKSNKLIKLHEKSGVDCEVPEKGFFIGIIIIIIILLVSKFESDELLTTFPIKTILDKTVYKYRIPEIYFSGDLMKNCLKYNTKSNSSYTLSNLNTSEGRYYFRNDIISLLVEVFPRCLLLKLACHYIHLRGGRKVNF
jgi:hypothetical protein